MRRRASSKARRVSRSDSEGGGVEIGSVYDLLLYVRAWGEGANDV